MQIQVQVQMQFQVQVQVKVEVKSKSNVNGSVSANANANVNINANASVNVNANANAPANSNSKCNVNANASEGKRLRDFFQRVLLKKSSCRAPCGPLHPTFPPLPFLLDALTEVEICFILFNGSIVFVPRLLIFNIPLFTITDST